MASTADAIRSVLQGGTAAAGEGTTDTDSSSSESSGVVVDEGRFVEAQESEVDSQDFLSNGEDTQADSEESPAPESKADSKPGEEGKTQTSSKEVITITDDKGRRRVEVDWNNKDQLRKYVQMAYGARKWQAERDQAISKSKDLEGKYGSLKQNWDVLEEAFQNQGEEGVIDLLVGRKGAFQERVKQEIAKQEFLRNASPEEIELHKAKEAAQARDRELERIRRENEEFKKQVQDERETAELRSYEAKAHPAFDKYRFADKLGNPDTEHRLDKMLWGSALESLMPYEEQGLEITPEMFERAFRSEAMALRSMINMQAEKKASKAIEQRKQEATENVQAKVMSGYRNNDSSKEARDLINSGNLTGLLKNWNKYGNLFRK